MITRNRVAFRELQIHIGGERMIVAEAAVAVVAITTATAITIAKPL
jgi:hypothetical protein